MTFSPIVTKKLFFKCTLYSRKLVTFEIASFFEALGWGIAIMSTFFPSQSHPKDLFSRQNSKF